MKLDKLNIKKIFRKLKDSPYNLEDRNAFVVNENRNCYILLNFLINYCYNKKDVDQEYMDYFLELRELLVNSSDETLKLLKTQYIVNKNQKVLEGQQSGEDDKDEEEKDIKEWFKDDYNLELSSNVCMSLAYNYEDQNKIGLAEKYYLMGCKYDDYYGECCIINIARMYKHMGKIEEMIKWSKIGVEKDILDAIYNFGTYYHNIENYKNAYKYYTMALEKGCERSKNVIERYKENGLLKKVSINLLKNIDNLIINQ